MWEESSESGKDAVLYLGTIGSYRMRMLIALPGMMISMGCAVGAIMLLLQFSRRLRDLVQAPPGRNPSLGES